MDNIWTNTALDKEKKFVGSTKDSICPDFCLIHYISITY